MTEIVITLEDDGSQWLPYQCSGLNAGCGIGERRVGTFSILQNTIADEDPTVFAVMSQVVVVHCEFDYARARFSYTAFSPHFRSVNAGAVPPEYLIVMHCNNEGRVDSFEFKEAEPIFVCPYCNGRGGFHKDACLQTISKE